MNKLAIVLCFGLAAACGGSGTSGGGSAGTGGSTDGGGGSGGGGGGIGAFVASCVVPLTGPETKQCNDRNAGTAEADTIAGIKSNPCPGMGPDGGTPSTSPCDHASSIGGCQTTMAGGDIITEWFYMPAVLADHKKSCEARSVSKWVNP